MRVGTEQNGPELDEEFVPMSDHIKKMSTDLTRQLLRIV